MNCAGAEGCALKRHSAFAARERHVCCYINITRMEEREAAPTRWDQA